MNTPTSPEPVAAARNSHTALLDTLLNDAPFAMLKIAEALVADDKTRLYQEWRYLRDDKIVLTPYHEFIDGLERDIEDVVADEYDAWPRGTSEAMCGTCGDWNSNHMGICPTCYEAESRSQYLADLIVKLKKEVAIDHHPTKYTDGEDVVTDHQGMVHLQQKIAAAILISTLVAGACGYAIGVRDGGKYAVSVAEAGK